MNTPSNQDARVDQAAISDEVLLAAHEQLLAKQPDERAHYRLLPLNLLFLFSGLIFFAGTYLNKFSAHFDPKVYDEEAPPGAEAAAATTAVDPIADGKKWFNQAACVTCHLV